MTRQLTRVAAAGAATTLLVLTAACSGGGGTDSMSAADNGVVSEKAAGRAAGGSGSGDVAAPADAPQVDGGPAANRTVVTVRSVIKTGEIALTAKDLDATRAKVDGLLVSLGGTIDSERSTHDRQGDLKRSTLVLRVPVDKFDTAMTELADLGKVRHSDSAAKDVTTQVIDVDERVQTLQNSLDRLQSYQRKAANLEDLIRFEQQITQRESELQSLKAQQDYLADQTSMSTISLYLSVPPKHVEPPGSLDDAGFLAGLKSGWHALSAAAIVALTVVGAVLPFLAVLALVGVPVWLLVRRTLRHRLAASGPAGPPPAAEHQGM
jgi:hypothetical protein